DFVQAADISRGTFYNHFESVEELLDATSEWTTREVIESIETALEGIKGPALRFGIGLRLFLADAQAHPIWCRFVARVWKLGGIELPARDLLEGWQLGVFRAPSPAAAQDLLFGCLREALLRMGSERTPAGYGDQITELCLLALGTDARQVGAVMSHDLPALARNREVG